MVVSLETRGVWATSWLETGRPRFGDGSNKTAGGALSLFVVLRLLKELGGISLGNGVSKRILRGLFGLCLLLSLAKPAGNRASLRGFPVFFPDLLSGAGSWLETGRPRFGDGSNENTDNTLSLFVVLRFLEGLIGFALGNGVSKRIFGGLFGLGLLLPLVKSTGNRTSLRGFAVFLPDLVFFRADFKLSLLCLWELSEIGRGGDCGCGRKDLAGFFP